MKHTPLILTEAVLGRMLKEFALKMGIEDIFAEVLVQTHLQISPIHRTWSSFLTNNCLQCAHSPADCAFLNTTEKDCTKDTSPASVRDANNYLIETGNLITCPLMETLK